LGQLAAQRGTDRNAIINELVTQYLTESHR
jgi:uncharacterized protein (UPF0297 family)